MRGAVANLLMALALGLGGGAVGWLLTEQLGFVGLLLHLLGGK